MGIQKQEFYEGAALHVLLRGGMGAHVAYKTPFFLINGSALIHLKYSTGVRSPWGFTFTADEQHLLYRNSVELPVTIGLICGSDGVAALPFASYAGIAAIRKSALRVSCARKHRQHFEISGPNGTLERKVPPSDWSRLLGEIA
ncbi:hypothetical protein [Luteimonas notoginsengisoli]|uniref:Uncharacterized protein n=1 Tax=Luteimonas notoginsengisoli TaxID=1578200 RepID=A0ABV7UTB6_9GAMM